MTGKTSVRRARSTSGDAGDEAPGRLTRDDATELLAERLAGLGTTELRRVRDHERRNANRKSVLAAIDRRLP